MKKTTIPIDKCETEDAMRKATNEMSRLYTILKIGELNKATIPQLENVKEEVILISTNAEITNLWYATIHGKDTPFYNHFMETSENVIENINYRIRQLEEFDFDPRNN